MSANQDRVHGIQQLLRVIFGVVPIAAGADKFFNFLTDWTQYRVIEIVAGIIVLSRFTVVGAYIVSAWLALIALSLIASGKYLDVAVRDLVMSTASYSLAVLSQVESEQTATAYRERRQPLSA